jgi:hypothetical protein
LTESIRRIAVSLGGGYVTGLAGVVRAVAQAAHWRGWQARDSRWPALSGVIPTVACSPSAGREPRTRRQGNLLGTGDPQRPIRVALQKMAQRFGTARTHCRSGRSGKT